MTKTPLEDWEIAEIHAVLDDEEELEQRIIAIRVPTLADREAERREEAIDDQYQAARE